MDSKALGHYWTKRYEEERTGWDIGYPSTPLKEYVDQLENKDLRILIPGAGNAYEAEYLHQSGFSNVFVLDVSEIPLKALQTRCPSFPSDHLLQEDFFAHEGSYDLILEQTFFCSFEPKQENRKRYAEQMHNLLLVNGKLVGVWFKHPLLLNGKRPFGGSKDEYLTYFNSWFDVAIFEDCHNSIGPRKGNELFGIFTTKKNFSKISSD